MEAPKRMVTSQDILHLRSPIWQGLGTVKASKRNISWMFLIRPFLWRGGWRPWDLGHEFHQSPTSSFASIAKQWNWHKLRRANALQGWVTGQSTWAPGTSTGRSLEEPKPHPRAITEKMRNTCWMGTQSSPYSWDWKPESSCKKWRKIRVFPLHPQAVTSSKK